jgi:hypothetical protein
LPALSPGDPALLVLGLFAALLVSVHALRENPDARGDQTGASSSISAQPTELGPRSIPKEREVSMLAPRARRRLTTRNLHGSITLV